MYYTVECAANPDYIQEKEMAFLPYPVRIWRNPGDYTTVEWPDGTKTTVKAENHENANDYAGFCACAMKKLYGSTSNAIRAMAKAEENAAWPAKQKEIVRTRLKQLRIIRAVEEKRARERRIKYEMECMKERAEAERRLNKQEEKE